MYVPVDKGSYIVTSDTVLSLIHDNKIMVEGRGIVAAVLNKILHCTLVRKALQLANMSMQSPLSSV